MTIFRAQSIISAARVNPGPPQAVTLADSQLDLDGWYDVPENTTLTAYFKHEMGECMDGNDPGSVHYALCAVITVAAYTNDTGTRYLTPDELAKMITGKVFNEIQDRQTGAI